MPVIAIHLIALTQETTLADFISRLYSTPSVKPVVVSRVIRWLIPPRSIDMDALLNPSKPWNLLVIASGTDLLPDTLKCYVECHWMRVAGVSSRLMTDFAAKNNKVLHPHPREVPGLDGSDGQLSETSSYRTGISSEMDEWIASFSNTHAGGSPLSMLNFLTLKPGMKSSYLQYAAAVANSIGSRRGLTTKLMGPVVTGQASSTSEANGADWEEFALVNYPSILHFAEMLASAEYQEINAKYRVPAVADTLILCTSEIEVERLMKSTATGDQGLAKL